MTYRVVMTLASEEHALRADTEKELRQLIRDCWTDYFVVDNKHWWSKLMAGEEIDVPCWGKWKVEEVTSAKAPCGECRKCMFADGVCIEESNEH